MFKFIREFRDFVDGYKTYIVAILVAIFAWCHTYGVAIPQWIWPILSAAGLGAVRAAIKKLEP